MTNSNFTYNDGGRAASGRKGTAGDCGVRAMAIALGLDYDACYKELAQANKDNGRAKSVRSGIMKDVYAAVLNRYGWAWHSAPKFDGEDGLRLLGQGLTQHGELRLPTTGRA